MPKKTSAFVPRMILKFSFLGVIPVCAVGVAACSSSSSHDVALAIIAFDAADDGADAREDADADATPTDTNPETTIVALADIGFRSDTSDAGDDVKDTSDTGSFSVADVGFGG